MPSELTPTPSLTRYINPTSTHLGAESLTAAATLRAPFYQPENLPLRFATTIETATSWTAQSDDPKGGGDIVNFRDVVTGVGYNWTVVVPALGTTLTEFYTW
jgi:hypothetical protein